MHLHWVALTHTAVWCLRGVCRAGNRASLCAGIPGDVWAAEALCSVAAAAVGSVAGDRIF